MKKQALFITVLISSLFFAQTKKEMTVEDMWLMQRIGDVVLSPDGQSIVFNSTSYSIELNKGNSDIFLMNVNGTGITKILGTEKSESTPRFTPDGKKITFLKDGQLWQCNLDGSVQEKLTEVYTGVDGYVWSPNGKQVLFTSMVYPECTSDECNKNRDEQKEKSKVKASIFTELMYRHWNDWRGEKRSHLFLLDIPSQKIVDITLYSRNDVPPIALGSAKDYSFAPDGEEIAFTMNPDKVLALSTNNEIYTVKTTDVLEGSNIKPRLISSSKGNDNQPVYSPDGKYIAYCSMERAGYEADKQRVMLFDRATGKTSSLTEKLDRSADELVWSPDSKYLYFNAAQEVNEVVYQLDIKTNAVVQVLNRYSNTNIIISPDGGKLIFKQQRTTLPYEIFTATVKGENIQQISSLNKSVLDRIEMYPAETFWSTGANGAKVQSLLIKPPFFDPNKKYPMIFLIHGGPQGHWSEDFHYRWNSQMFAAMGYVVVATNPRGSTGYGQKFTDEICGDWGGKPYTDLMNAYDYAVKNFSFIDAKNTFAAGASYGGYMINWIAGHTNRFNALVSHAGVFNLESMYGTTEELWFPEWENKGTPWSNRKMYEKFSPHRYIHNCKTPVLVVHGAYDFRVPEEQAFQLFTSLQRLGVESKFLYFPDETHFVAKPQNAKLWWTTVSDWYKLHLKK